MMQLMGAHQLTPPPPLADTVPAALQTAVMRMLAETAEERWPDLRALGQALA